MSEPSRPFFVQRRRPYEHEFADALHERRMSHAQAGELLGLTSTTINELERGTLEFESSAEWKRAISKIRTAP